MALNRDFEAFDKQSEVLVSKARGKGAFAGKRGGKTEIGAIDSILKQEHRLEYFPNYIPNGIDPYLGVIAAPTTEMLKRLSWKKFMAYARPFIRHDIKNPYEIYWHTDTIDDPSEIYGISAEKPERMEGIKAYWIWIDEVFQVKEHFFLECLARLSDAGGYLLCTGSLGVQHINPKEHWAYKYFKENVFDDYRCFEWATSDNPHFPKEELERQKRILDKRTYEAMYTITWDIKPKSAVYSDFDEENVKEFDFNPAFETYIVIDWGWTHPMACGIVQYDRDNDIVYLYDEIVMAKLEIDNLYQLLAKKEYLKTQERTIPLQIETGETIEFTYEHILGVTWICDIAGKQTREYSGISNVRKYKMKYNVKFLMRKSSILEGIAIVRSYISNSLGERRFFVHKNNCPKTISGLRRYAYPERDGIILNENPVKKDDDEADMVRYFFWNILDFLTANRKSGTTQL